MVPVTTTQTPATCSPVRACWLRAWDRAKSEKLIPYRNADGSWSVKGYTVAITGPGWSDLSCSCAAGRNHRICKHQAVTAKAIAVGVLPIKGTEKTGKEVAPAATFTPAQLAVIASGVAPSLVNLYA